MKEKLNIALLFMALLFTPNLVQVASATSANSLRVTRLGKNDITSITAVSNFTSQIYNGTPPPNDQIYNTTNPQYSIQGTPLDEVNTTEGPVTVNVLLAGDEEAQNTQYWIGTIPMDGDIYVDWITYAEWQIERGDEALVAKFGIDLRIRGAVTWHSTNVIPYAEWLNAEMINQTGWNHSFKCNGYEIDVLFGIVGQSMDVVGQTFAEYENRPNYMNTILVHWFLYWADDNIVQHEFSHIFFTNDHKTESDSGYYDDCIMSYCPQYVFFLYEDGYIWIVFNSVRTCALSYNYCTECHNLILSWKYHDIDFNGIVEIYDLAIASNAYGSYPGAPNWDARADVNWDGKVDIYDITLIAKYYGLVIWT